MNLSAYIPLGGSVCNFLFALFIFTRAPRAIVNRVYLVSGLSIATWNLGCFFMLALPPEDHDMALFWARFLQVGVLYAIAAFVHLSLLIAGSKVGNWIRYLYGFQTLLVFLNLTPLYLTDVHHRGVAGWYALAGPAFYLIFVPYSLSFVAIFVLWRKRKTLPPLQKHRLTTLLAAQILIAAFGINDLLPIMAWDYYPYTQVLVYPYGSLVAVFYGVLVAYSVLHHQLLDVRVALSGALAHLVRFAFLFAITGGMLLAAATFSNAFTPMSIGLSMGVFILSAVSATFLFPKLFGGKGVEKLERQIMGDHFEYQEQIHSFIKGMTWYQDLNLLMNDLDGLLRGNFRLSRYQIILRDEISRAFTLLRAHPEEVQRPIAELKAQSPIFQYFEWREVEYLSLANAAPRLGTGVLEEQARQQLSAFDAELCLPLSSENEAFGLMLVGGKTNGEPFTATDINLLVALVKNLSLMVNQIRLKNQISQAQELDLLGRMSRGMAHDLNNLLTPVWTLLQLSAENGGTPVDEELLPVAVRNLKTMRAYIKEALFFSENLRPDLQLGRFDLVLRQAADLARASRKKEIELVAETPGEVLVEMDEVLMQRLLANLISNAIDASPEGGRVEIHLDRLARTDANRDWVRARIVDHGEGIPKENLSRVLTPYFTTKNHGDENRGFGLGLAICRKIVNLHGGQLDISSQVRRGTTVQVDLPTRQMRPAAPIPATSVS
jgi:signal transduction histidine kinase